MNEEKKLVYVVTRITAYCHSLDSNEILCGVFTNELDAIDFVAKATKSVLEHYKKAWPNAVLTDGLTVVVPDSHHTYFYVECVTLDVPTDSWM